MQTQTYQAAAPALEYVGVGKRLFATIIDCIVLGLIAGAINAAFPSGAVTNVNGVMTSVPSGPGTALGIIIPLAYYIVLEAIMGATLGKIVLGLRIVKLDGSHISWGQAIVRTLLRIIDGIFVYLVAAILVSKSPKKQRLGDRVAKTVVIRRR